MHDFHPIWCRPWLNAIHLRLGDGSHSGTALAHAEKYTLQWVSGLLTQISMATASACIFVGRVE
jgi:hypothetical protein